MSNRDELINKMQDKLEQWNAEIDALVAKAGEITTDFKNEHHEQIESLKVKLAAARLKIEELEQSGESAYGDLKSGVEQAWTTMVETIESAISRFK